MILVMRNKLIVGCVVLFAHFVPYDYSSVHGADNHLIDDETIFDALRPLENKCLDSLYQPDWWSYIWCYRDGVRQVHFDHQEKEITTTHFLGEFSKDESSARHHIYRNSMADCIPDNGGLSTRYVETSIRCCDENTVSNYRRFGKLYESNQRSFIESVTEPRQCAYYINICTELLCDEGKRDNGAYTEEVGRDLLDERHPIIPSKRTQKQSTSVDSVTQEKLLERVSAMFIHGYDSYLQHAFPEGELRPITCDGGQFEPIKIPAVTLIDALDTLVVMGNYTEFRRAVSIVSSTYRSFALDVNVSVFETTIRILGGLLSAHLMAIDPSLGIYSNISTAFKVLNRADHTRFDQERTTFTGATFDYFSVFDEHLKIDEKQYRDDYFYDNFLLTLALDLGHRLLPAFDTKTGIPYGTVNLLLGVPRGETEIASTAGAGSLIIEFEVLSRLTGDSRFGDAAYKAAQALFDRRSTIGLVGKHIHTKTGKWFESASGIGSNSDSFYEYLLKTYLLFGRRDFFSMFGVTYSAIKQFVQTGDWFGDVDMFNGKMRRNRVESLHGFWAGMEATIGLFDSSTKLLNSLYAVWSDMGFLPEEFDQTQWLAGKEVVNNAFYPLRPELIESTYHHYRATGDRSWLRAGELFLESLEEHTHTDCGYASIENMKQNTLSDSMPSFFLSETCKYLYLLFDETNFVHERPYIFSTEAHPFDPTQLPPVERPQLTSELDSPASQTTSKPKSRQPMGTIGSVQPHTNSPPSAVVEPQSLPQEETSAPQAYAHAAQPGDIENEVDGVAVERLDSSGDSLALSKEIARQITSENAADDEGEELTDELIGEHLGDHLLDFEELDFELSHPGHINLNIFRLELTEKLYDAARKFGAENRLFKALRKKVRRYYRKGTERMGEVAIADKLHRLQLTAAERARSGEQHIDPITLADTLFQQQKAAADKARISNSHTEEGKPVRDSKETSADSTKKLIEETRADENDADSIHSRKQSVGSSLASMAPEHNRRTNRNARAEEMPAPETILSAKCPSRVWWDAPVAYNDDYFDDNTSPRLQERMEAEAARAAAFLSVGRISHILHITESDASKVRTVSDNRCDTQQLSLAPTVGDRETDEEFSASEFLSDGDAFGTVSDDDFSEGLPKQRRRDTCYADEQPNIGTHPNVQQKVDVSMGPLGEFSIEVYTDGFVVHSKEWGDTIEISNVGQSNIFVLNYDQQPSSDTGYPHRTKSAKTVVGDLSGRIVTCSVGLVDATGQLIDFKPSRLSSKSPGKKKLGASPTHAGEWERSCSVAAFGPALKSPLWAPLTMPPKNDAELCKPVPSPPSETIRASSKRWWAWATRGPSAASASNGESLPLAGQVVLAKRGECMFEDKTLHAQRAGSVGVLVVNSEDALFIMSSKRSTTETAASMGELVAALKDHKQSLQSKHVQDPSSPPIPVPSNTGSPTQSPTPTPSPPPQGKPTKLTQPAGAISEALSAVQQLMQNGLHRQGEETSHEEIRIPTVMLTKTDAEQLLDLAHVHVEDNGTPPYIRIEATVRAMSLDNEFMGYDEYPKVRVTRNMVQVIGRGQWGVVLSSNTEQEWQLFIMSKADLTNPQIAPWTIKSKNDLWMSAPPAFTQNPVEMYAALLAKKCPSFLSFDGSNVILQ